MKPILVMVLAAGLLFWDCSHQHNESHQREQAGDDDGHHDHDEIKQKLVVYTDDFELYAEADPFVEGEKAGILAHFTLLPGFNPLNQAKLTASLLVGGQLVGPVDGQALQAGIYQFFLTPGTTGEGMLSFSIEQDGEKKTVEVAVPVFKDDHKAIHYYEDRELNHGNAIVFTKEQSWKIDFATAFPSPKPFGPVLKASAVVQTAPEKSQIMSAATSGMIRFMPGVVEGIRVNAGQELFRISGSGMADDNVSVVFATARTNYEKEKADLERMEKLAEKQLVSQRELLEVKSSFEKAETVYKNLQQNFSSAGQLLAAPVTGNLGRIFVQNGQHVSAGQAVAGMIQQGRIQLKAEIQQKYVTRLKQIQAVTVRSAGQTDWQELSALNGKLLSVGSQVSQENFLLPVYFELDNQAEFLPGSFVELNLRMTSETNCLVVPNTALVEQQGHFFVMVQLDPEHFEKRQVITGDSDGLETIIRSGLNADERVVTKGAVLVNLAAVSNSLDPHAGHVH